ncbi:hypothetical protein [Vibrio scophthalmi]|uniref:Uncharacterized protein n=1 Tax=Vibrio scophthalmi TaxID=45658 RepID=A0A1E3WME3_9VIBR|nr:hypothetical protein [Vibrio scophthalmi]ODS10152.1 hypothetical protein VSF3289_00407 [Vibrio scophthalmi]
MPIHKGYLVCSCCQSAAKVMEAEGKRTGKLYVVCPECGTDQSHLPKRQEYIRNHMVESLDALTEKAEPEIPLTPEPEIVSDIVSDDISEPLPPSEKSVSGWAIGGAILLTVVGLGALARKVA